MRCHLLEILIPAVISSLLFWEGVRCNNSGYSLSVSSPVTVQEGLCVTIPCTFTYDASGADPSAPLYGYWYKEKGNVLVATNNPAKVDEIGLDRIRYTMSGPNLNRGDCSLTILQPEAADNNTVYFFRMEKKTGYSYNQEGRKVSLIMTERKLDLTVPEPLRAGHKANISCTAQWCSSSGRPAFIFRGVSEDSTYLVENNSSESYIVEFVPSAADHQRNVTCKATYGRGANRVTVERTITLNVSYAPRMFQFSGSHTLRNGTVQEFRSSTQIVAEEGDSLLVRCEADSNPEGTETWVKKPQSSTTRLTVLDNTLQLLDLTLNDKGNYTCLAQNQEGSTEGVFYLQMPYSPTHCDPADTKCWREDGGYKCNCSICSYPSSTIEWQVNGKIYKGNTSNTDLKIGSWNETEEKAFSILHLFGEWREDTPVICQGKNHKGQYAILYQRIENKVSGMLTGAVVGALLMFAVVMSIVIIAVTCLKCQKGNKPMINPESYRNYSGVILTEKAQDAKIPMPRS